MLRERLQRRAEIFGPRVVAEQQRIAGDDACGQRAADFVDGRPRPLRQRFPAAASASTASFATPLSLVTSVTPPLVAAARPTPSASISSRRSSSASTRTIPAR